MQGGQLVVSIKKERLPEIEERMRYLLGLYIQNETEPMGMIAWNIIEAETRLLQILRRQAKKMAEEEIFVG